MIGRLICLVAGVLLSVSVPAQQQGGGDALQMLQKVATAAQKATYTGVFVYQSGNRSETSRLTHVVEGGNEYERLEVLDGSPREVLRRNDEVRCFLPDNKLLIVEHRNAKNLFPTLLPGSLAGLTEYYRIRKGAIDRVAGVDGQQIVIEPKDEFRYGHGFWVDPHSGILLKATLVDENGRLLESFAFTELRIGTPFDPRTIISEFEGRPGNWQVQNVRSVELKGDDGQWSFRASLPGFRRVSAVRRQLRPDAPEGTQIVFSDGLASISVFLEPMAGRSREEDGKDGGFSVGAVNGYRRQVADYQVIVMGDVPPAALRRFADNIELKRK